MKRINSEHIIGIVCMAIGAVVLLLTRSFPKGAASSMQLTGPDFFPNLLAIILIILGLGEIFIGFRKAGPESEFGWNEFKTMVADPRTITILIIIGMLLFYLIFVKILGFFITSFIFLIVILWRMKIVWWKNIITSIIFLGIIYLLFVEVFTTRFPSGILF